MTNLSNGVSWQVDVGHIVTVGLSAHEGAKMAPPKGARCNAAFSCSLWASDSCNGMDLYPSYSEKAGELDRA